MFILVYRSKYGSDTEDPVLMRMLERARIKNHEHGITGCLLFHQGSFLQLIEGGQDAVRNLYSRIQNDPRHNDVELLCAETITGGRLFDRWSMLCSDIGENPDRGEEKLRLFMDIYNGAGVPAVPGRSKFVLWEHMHEILSAQYIPEVIQE